MIIPEYDPNANPNQFIIPNQPEYERGKNKNDDFPDIEMFLEDKEKDVAQK